MLIIYYLYQIFDDFQICNFFQLFTCVKRYIVYM